MIHANNSPKESIRISVNATTGDWYTAGKLRIAESGKATSYAAYYKKYSHSWTSFKAGFSQAAKAARAYNSGNTEKSKILYSEHSF